MKKSANGTVGVEHHKGKLRLRLPRSVSQSINRYISTGLPDTSENYKKVQVVAWQIEEDIKSGQVDLEKYRVVFKPTVSINTQSLDLMELWQKYCEFKCKQLAPTTYRRDYRRYTNHVKALPTKDLSQAISIRDYLMENFSVATVKRVLTYLNACCKWAVTSGLAQQNPFDGMATGIKNNTRSSSIDPFNQVERDNIIQAFQEHPRHKHYASFVQFLFLTGCRTGEAIALQWKHISKDYSAITFEESFDSGLGIRKDTKNHTVRRFPCNAVLRALLEQQKQLAVGSGSNDPVFTSPTGLTINSSRFVTQVWKGSTSGIRVYQGVVSQLVERGLVERYRCPYNTRHTYITMALEAGVPITLLAKWVGNSPEVIMRHYAGTLVQMESPVI